MKKRAQIFGEPFIFIFAIVVAAMVLVFGIKIYYDLNERADFAQIADIVQRINEDVTTFYNLEEGSSNKFTFTFPNSVECFCFIDSQNKDFGSLTGKCNDPSFKSKLLGSVGTSNVVFWKYSEKKTKGENPASLPEKANINSKFTVAPSNPLCIDLAASRYKLNIRLESKGNEVLIEKI